MPTASAKALRPESRSRFRVVLAQEWFRERFWVVPTVLLVAGVAVGLAVSRVDSIPGLAEVGGGLPVRASSAEALLGIIAASMLTFVGVVFTITLVALQLASAQLSPRVIRTFVRSGITKVAFGLFLATFGYAIVVIVVEGASSSPDVLRLAVTLGVLFVLASLVVFVVYVTATMRLLQVSWVVTAVADETRRAISANRPVAASYLSAAAPQLDQDPRLVRLEDERDDGTSGQIRCDSRDRPRAVGPARTAVRLPAAVPAKGGRVSPARRCHRGGPRWERPARRRSTPLRPPRPLTHDVPGSAVRNPPTRRCCQPGPVTGGQPADHSRYRHRPSRGAVAADRPTPTAHGFLRRHRRCRAAHAFRSPPGPRLSTWRSPRSPSTGRRRRRSPDGWPRHTSACTSRSPSICVLTSIGISLSSSLLPAQRSCPSIRWPPLAQILEDLADDINRRIVRRTYELGPGGQWGATPVLLCNPARLAQPPTASSSVGHYPDPLAPC